MTILQAIGQWILRMLLSGIFNKVMTKIEMEAKQKEEAAKLHAESTEKAAAVEIAVAKKQAEAKDAVEAARTPEDPFGVDGWNKGNSNG